MINESPTDEFAFLRGLHQGDPLFSFLFTLVMKALNVMMTKVVDSRTFMAVKLPKEGMVLSHLFYANDALFIGEWSEFNFKNLNRILRCFHMASGLKVSLDKSKVFGMGVGNTELEAMENIF
ncbi:uncharacterized protein LOC110893411 [Helianthus annuus]|uniref:uncharacterized protein LOC110893411 n=1 Tax=Helianthus annuus TaxID=4232 RepID=UPI000B8FFCCE|nr:uncharacterized protein LOC110893411 [Helianthus annuus]